MICGWSGIGKVGLVAVNAMRRLARAVDFAAIEPYRYFEPSHVVIRDGRVKEMRFPTTRLYSYRRGDTDIVFVVGEEQPATSEKAYQMATEVLDAAEGFGCQRIYTSAASVATIHHTSKPRVWVVPNDYALIPEIRKYGNTVLMSEVEAGDGDGIISGLNGLLLGAAQSRGIEAVCLMGEVPYYLQGAPWPYPKASISVIEVLSRIVNLPLDLSDLQEEATKVEANIEHVLDTLAHAEALPEQVRAEMESLRNPQPDLGPITDTEKREILEHIDELFKGENSHGS